VLKYSFHEFDFIYLSIYLQDIFLEFLIHALLDKLRSQHKTLSSDNRRNLLQDRNVDEELFVYPYDRHSNN